MSIKVIARGQTKVSNGKGPHEFRLEVPGGDAVTFSIEEVPVIPSDTCWYFQSAVPFETLSTELTCAKAERCVQCVMAVAEVTRETAVNFCITDARCPLFVSGSALLALAQRLRDIGWPIWVKEGGMFVPCLSGSFPR